MTDNNNINKTIQVLKETAEIRQLLLAEIDRNVVNQTIKRIQEKTQDEIRQSKRLKVTETQQVTPIASKDKLLYEGLDGSLGYNLKKHAMTITPLTRKQKYFYYTCINGIVDVSTMCRLAFLKSVPKQMTEIIIKDLTSVNTAKFADYNLQCGSSLKQVNNNYSLKNTITSIDNFTPSNEIEECVKEIYLFILKLHYRKPFSFYQERIELYSEEDYVVKFWANVFESFFGSNEHLFLHWGDTQAKACKNNGLSMKLDMRIMIMKNGKHVVEGGTCEYAKNPVRSKYFRDRLKLVLASKAYINNVIENSPYLAEEDIKNIKIPLIQIMGFEAQLSTISVKEKGIYAVEDLLKFSFPTSKKQIRQGGINNIIKALSLIQHLIHELEELLEEGKVDREGGKMTSISNETSHKKNKAKDWIDEVVCPANTDNSEEDGDKEDED